MIKKVCLVVMLPLLPFFSLWAPTVLSELANTQGVSEYNLAVEQFLNEGSLTSEEKLNFDKLEEQYKQDIISDEFLTRKVMLDYFFIPLVLIFFSLVWFFWGKVISCEAKPFRYLSVFASLCMTFYLAINMNGVLYFFVYGFALMVAFFVTAQQNKRALIEH